MPITSVNIGGKYFPIGQIFDKTLYASGPVKIYRSVIGQPVYTANAGQPVGIVYSYVERDGILWWQFLDTYNKPYYAKHSPTAFSLSAIVNQGSQTHQEIEEQKEKDKNPVLSTIAETAQRILMPVAIAAAVYYLVKSTK